MQPRSSYPGHVPPRPVPPQAPHALPEMPQPEPDRQGDPFGERWFVVPLVILFVLAMASVAVLVTR